MSARKLRLWRRLAGFMAVGAGAMGTGPCDLSEQDIGAFLQAGAELVTREAAVILSDTVFFLLDNFLVRLTAG